MALWKGLPWENGENPSKKVSLSADLRWSESEMIQRGFSGTDRQIDGISSGIWKEKPGNTPFFVGGFSVFLWLFKSIHWFLGTWRLGSHIQKLNWESKSQRKIKMESQKKGPCRWLSQQKNLAVLSRFLFDVVFNVIFLSHVLFLFWVLFWTLNFFTSPCV